MLMMRSAPKTRDSPAVTMNRYAALARPPTAKSRSCPGLKCLPRGSRASSQAQPFFQDGQRAKSVVVGSLFFSHLPALSSLTSSVGMIRSSPFRLVGLLSVGDGYLPPLLAVVPMVSPTLACWSSLRILKL